MDPQPRRRLLTCLVLALVVVFAGCSDQDAQLIVRGAGPDGCEYEGPTEISEGPHEMLATPSGIGHIILEIHRLSSLPSGGAVPEIELGEVITSVEHENDVNFARKQYAFAEGSYAVVCIYDGFEGVVGTFVVRP